MTVLPILISGEPVLHTPAKPVERFDSELRTLVADMIETMHKAPGVGLAGPQVGKDLRLFVYEWDDEHGVKHQGVAVNPTLWIQPTTIDELDEDEETEGCLSLPGLSAPLRRSTHARLEAFDEHGNEFTVEAQGWLARIFQHEYDHLGGILYRDRLIEAERKTIDKASKKERWGVPGLSWLPGDDEYVAE
ncbi:peptide deformylase [Humidisolicoccus flavus]|uniref:peptide deformylase n=1 Tax=Humidisolicoccus flavus TaxID=3111414 RepID=UPI0032518B61